MTWRTFLLTVVAAAAAGVLVMCQLRTRTVDLATSSASTAAQDAYLEDARSEAPELWAATDSVLLRAGAGLCAGIRRLAEPQVAPSPVGGLSASELRGITDAATRHLCPSARPKVTTYLNRSAR